MPYIAANAALYVGKKVGSGDSVAFVQSVSNAPSPATWTAGIQVLGASQTSIERGTVIAAMENGQFAGHAAIYVDQDTNGIRVLDQWIGESVSFRTISPQKGAGSVLNDAFAFYVAE